MGSLFQLRDYWYSSFTGEEFSPSAITMVDADAPMLFDKIAIGSFQGMLRIINPSAVQGPMSPDDLLLEKQYEEPILQLECGQFRPFSSLERNNLLAILFPRALVFLEVTARGTDGSSDGITRNSSNGAPGGSGDAASGVDGGDSSTSPTDAATPQKRTHRRGSMAAHKESAPRELSKFYALTVHSEIFLEHTSYNFVSGSFGRIEYNMVCVQSMDGLLTIADHSSILYRSFFPHNQFFLPGPLTYCACRDTLLTCSSSMFLLCYSYSSIVKSTVGLGDAEHGGGGAAGAAYPEVAASRTSTLRPLWAFNLGEDAVDIAVCRLTRGLPREQVDVIVLCSSILYILNEAGVPRTIRRLDVEAASLCVYPLPEIQYDNLLVGTFNGLVQVYSDTELEWSAAVPSGAAPLYLGVGTLCGVEGMIVNLSSDSTLTINYLGTDPVSQHPQALDSKAASYPEVMNDLKQAEQLIHGFTEGANEDDALVATAGASPTKKKAAQKQRPTNAAQVPPSPLPKPAKKARAAELSVTSEFGTVDPAESAAVLTVTLRTLESAVDGVSVVVEAVAPLLVSPAQHRAGEILSGSTTQFSFTVKAVQDKDFIIPSSLEVAVVVVYRGQRRQVQAVQHVVLAPLLLVARPVSPVKNTAFSVQINTDKSPPPSLVDLFQDMAAYGTVAPNVLSLHYLNGADATVLVSKNAARFKLQGSTMEGLWLLAHEVTRRVRSLYDEAGRALFEMPDEVPLADFLGVVDTHWAIRKEMAVAQTGLDQAADLFRAVEKRLLARFRDRSPADATAVAVLFEESYKLLQERADAVTLAKRRLRQAAAMLNCCAQLTWLCIELKSPHMNTEDANTLRALFRCSVSDTNDVGWEEVTEAVLAKVLDIKTKKVASTTLELATNTVNVKTYVRALVEFIKSGRRLCSS
jgi:Bardet-Biedl syndrome 9 protein